MSSHKDVQLPMKTSLPIDWENTKHLFHYDISENCSLTDVKPIGNRWALDFDGNDQFVETGQQFQFTKESSFSVDFWINFRSHLDKESASAGLVGKGHWHDQTWDILLLNSHKVRLEVGSGSRGQSGTVTSGTLATEVWHHITAVYDNKKMSLYVNGILHDSATYSYNNDFNNSNAVLIAKRPNDSTRTLRGKMSDVRIWNKALSAQEVKYYMNNHVEDDENNLIASWKLDEGEGVIIKDQCSDHLSQVVGGVKWTDGRSVWTLRQGEGKYGGAIAVEESTENGIGSLTFDRLSVTRTTLSEASDKSPVLNEKVFKQISTELDPIVNIHDSSGMGYAPQSSAKLPVVSGQSVTFSIWAKGEAGGERLQLFLFQYSGVSGSQYIHAPNKNFTLSTKWERYEFTDIVRTDSKYAWIRIDGHDSIIGETFYWSAPQLETKTFATSFTPNTREDGMLEYPIFPNMDNFTVAFWMKKIGEVVQYAPVFSVEGDSIDNSMTMDFFSNEQMRFFVYSSTGVAINASDYRIPITDGVWKHLAFTKDGDNMKIYEDGVLTHTFSSPNQKVTGSIRLGRRKMNHSNRVANCLYDELRIDSVARTADEIANWYASQSPFFPKGMHKLYL